ncbi:MAG: sulfatase [Anaerolineae bacterium]|nr:MAG: sulfatase [Anaerolineae bacterium]
MTCARLRFKETGPQWFVRAVVFFLLGTYLCGASEKRPNVLFICTDDLNDWVGCLGGRSDIMTPNIDSLAERGVLFTNAHCPAPLCNPCRTAIMTGLRPGTTGIYNNNAVWAKKIPDWVTLPRHFKNNGYHVAGAGKIYHHTPKGFNPRDQWHEYFDLIPDQGTQAEHVKHLGLDREYFSDMPEHPHGSWDWGPFQKDDYEMGDGHAVKWAIDFLQRKQDKPFFLAVGLFQPHLPFYAPAKYFDRYPKETVALPAVPQNDLDDLPPAAAEIAQAGRDKRFKMVVECGELRPAVRGYLSSISHADTLIGGLLKALDESPYARNTIIVFWSDHGYHFGEKQRMAKRSLWERATRVPLIVVAPGITRPGSRCNRPVDLMALYPTLVELCGLPPRKKIEGDNITALLRDPDAQWDHVAITTHSQGSHSIRDQRWRYIHYVNGDEELYDHETDPNEWNNLADRLEYASVKKKLTRWLPKDGDAKDDNE